ncbi:MAG TPA: indolepyruvate ferredoxin oxidoreductase family protein [Bryobacteraceae bacterium]|nr:indolepyruvate ferredoxin oxidoreductase family protein [Bryobacteraceae bacterium]
MNLSDRYALEKGTVYLTGIQALVRLPIEQMRRDRRAGLHTGTFISGYEGSPLGGYDLTLARSRKLLDQYNIHFQPGVNEDLAATSVMGSQIFDVLGKSNVDGVLGIWYGKGPGVDRSGDIFRHANLAGTGKNCAALVLAGDDHISKSSTIPHQSDFSLYNVGIPFFYPGNVQEVLDYGLYAIALSRFSGAWVGMKMVTDVCDGGGTAVVDPDTPGIQIPGGYQKLTDVRLVPPISLALENEVNVRRLGAALSFAALNGVNRWRGAKNARVGLLSAGKAYHDMMQALRDLGVRETDFDSMGIRVGKVAMPFPLEPEFVRGFSEGLEKIFVVEEKRSFLELQLREILYDAPHRPAVLGKSHLPPLGELNPDQIAQAASRILGIPVPPPRQRTLAAPQSRPADFTAPPRPAAFCSGCPHNRSTLLLEGQIAGGGIGCHTMAMRLMDPSRSFSFLTQMGGEGAPWIGMAPFVNHGHIFQNIGDGTLFHSGYLAIEACVAAGVNITYKILYNGHVAMTGGQHATGALPVPELTRKLEAEGVKRTVVLAEDVTRYEALGPLAANATLRDRSELPATLREMEAISGVTAIIYDQECAAEKRRARSRGKAPEPVKRLVIQEEVCEGCGDCVKQSNCMSLNPVATELGQKMRIHQSSCNKDYSCALGDCPSFVTVNLTPGTGRKKRSIPVLPAADVPAPARMTRAGDGYRILAPGIGGTGVVTVNALLATAAWLDGLSVATLDQTGTAQKGGAVVSHILLSESPIEAPAKVNAGNANLILGFDLLGAASAENLKTADPEKTIAVVNTDISPTIDTIRNRQPAAGPGRLVELVNAATMRGHNLFVDANRLAEGLFGSHLAGNLFLTGVAWQAGLIPIRAESIEKAIEWNGVEAEQNRNVFQWGRKYYEAAAWVESQLAPKQTEAPRIFDRVAELKAYQGESYARAYSDFLTGILEPALREVVARYLYKLMAYKDEYEVARLLTKADFEAEARSAWESVESISYNLHPPFLRRFGVKKKITPGAWFRVPLKILAALKFTRGTPLDLFGYSAHRRMERSLVDWYRELIGRVLPLVTESNLSLALEIAALPDQIRGYEQIKEESVRKVKALADEKFKALKEYKERPIPAPV